MSNADLLTESLPMRERIIDAASVILNEKGIGGLTFAETGHRVGLKLTSVTHYFKRREDLAAACFDLAIDRLNELVAKAETEPAPQSRVRRYIDENVAILRAARLGEDRPIPVLSGIVTLEAEQRERLGSRFRDFFRRVRALFGEVSTRHEIDQMTARAHVLLEMVFWLPNSLRNYPVEDYGRFSDHLFMILRDGLGGAGATWNPTLFDIAMPVEPRGLRDIIKAATTLINEQGYKGASINKVVGLLGLTKGSFYHHLESREALTLDCFSASHRTILDAQRIGKALPCDSWTRLTSIVASLISYQFSTTGPLLRTTALQGLPLEQRLDVIGQSDDVARRFADLVTDSFVNGAGRPVDATIAGQILISMINGAYVMLNWSRRRPADEAISIYATTVVHGLFSELAKAREPALS